MFIDDVHLSLDILPFFLTSLESVINLVQPHGQFTLLQFFMSELKQ